MKVKDITEEWAEAIASCAGEFGDSPNDKIDWKGIRIDGFDAVSVDGIAHAYCKHGLLDPINNPDD